MAMEASNATELADTDIEIDDSSEPKSAGSPVKDAFDRGVLGGELPNVPIPPEPVEPDPLPHRQDAAPIDLAREAIERLEFSKRLSSHLANEGGDEIDRILEKADPLQEAISSVLARIERAKVDLEKATAEAEARHRGLALDPDTMKKVVDAAKQKARSDVLGSAGKELDALAAKVEGLAAELEGQLRFENAFSDPDLREALDGQRSPSEKSSEDYLVARLEGQSVAEIAETHELMQLDHDKDRLRRFERAMASALDSIVSRRDQEIARGITRDQSEEKLTEAKNERAAAAKLRDGLRRRRANLRPKGIQYGEQLARTLKEAWQRLAGFDARRGAGAVSPDEMARMRADESRMAKARTQAKTWKPLEGWHERHFRKAK